MSIVTKTGDNGDTSLVGNRRVSKADPRMHAIGTVDELNALLGVALTSDTFPLPLNNQCTTLQHRLFTLGADLAAPDVQAAAVPRITDAHVKEIEQWITEKETTLEPLTKFILPGGSRAGALLHHARTVCRRAERWVVALSEQETVRPELRIFLNRLSDYLFLAAREMNLIAKVGEQPVEYDSSNSR